MFINQEDIIPIALATKLQNAQSKNSQNSEKTDKATEYSISISICQNLSSITACKWAEISKGINNLNAIKEIGLSFFEVNLPNSASFFFFQVHLEDL